MRKLLGVTAVATIAIAVAACSGKSGSGDSNKVTGTIGGSTFTPKSGSFTTVSLGPTRTVDVGVLSDDPSFCANAGTSTVKANGKFMLLEFGQVVGSNLQPATAPGTYTVIDVSSTAAVPAMFFGGYYNMFDNSCQTISASQVNLVSGQMDLTKVTSSVVGKNVGGIGMASGDSIGLSIALQDCPALATLLVANSAGTCAP